jgi:hypothetical protein
MRFLNCSPTRLNAKNIMTHCASHVPADENQKALISLYTKALDLFIC